MEYQIPQDLYYTKSHEWAKTSGGEATVGITSYAVEQMDKEIVNVELPEQGTQVEKGESFGVVDSVKAAFDLYAPVSGEVIKVNHSIEENPEKVAESPYEEGWMIIIRMSDTRQIDQLMKASDYRSFLETAE